MTRWLVLDDNHTDRMTMSRALKDAGCEVVIADHFDRARELLKTEVIDLCLFDFFFQNESATSDALIAELRESMPDLPIVLISAACQEKDIERCLWAGADLFVPKVPYGLALVNLLKSAGFMAGVNRRRRIEWTFAGDKGKIYLRS